MKPISVQDDIVPIGEFKTHASRILREMKTTGRPVVITQNGRAAGVLVSPEAFDRFTERERLVAAVQQGQADADAGRLVSDTEVAARFERRHRESDER